MSRHTTKSAIQTALEEKKDLGVILGTFHLYQEFSYKNGTLTKYLKQNMENLIYFLFVPSNSHYSTVVSLFKCIKNQALAEELFNGTDYLNILSAIFFINEPKELPLIVFENVISIFSTMISPSKRNYQNNLTTILKANNIILGLVKNMHKDCVYMFLSSVVSLPDIKYSSFLVQILLNFVLNQAPKSIMDGINEAGFDLSSMDSLRKCGIDINENLGNFWRLCYEFVSKHNDCIAFIELLSFYFQQKQKFSNFSKYIPLDDGIMSNAIITEIGTCYQYKCAQYIQKPIPFLDNAAISYALSSYDIGSPFMISIIEYLSHAKIIDNPDMCDDETNEDLFDAIISLVRKCILVPFSEKYIIQKYKGNIPNCKTINATINLLKRKIDDDDIKEAVINTLLFWETLNMKGNLSRANAISFINLPELDSDDELFIELKHKYQSKPYDSNEIVVPEERIAEDKEFYQALCEQFQN